jgi:hypothetical protein
MGRVRDQVREEVVSLDLTQWLAIGAGAVVVLFVSIVVGSWRRRF